MIGISRNIKLEIYNVINLQEFPYGDISGDNGIIDFLDKIWNLEVMPSTDDRFKDASGDIWQHMVNNDDWEIDYLFKDRLGLLEDEEKFILFIETIISPEVRFSEDNIMNFVLLLNPYLEKDNQTLLIEEYNEEDIPVYKIKPLEDKYNQIDIIKNNIPFFVEKNSSEHSDIMNSNYVPPEIPSFVLVPNTSWNDFGIESEFCMYYYSSEENYETLGDLKIIEKEAISTYLVMDSKFFVLKENFCSLGMDADYYINLKKVFGRNFLSVLSALNDAAFFTDIHDHFERNSNFTASLIRFDESERLLREAPYIIYGHDVKNRYSFKYNFSPKYSNKSINIDFNFNAVADIPNRIYSIIGKNGSGKTQLITSLPIDISRKRDDVFLPKTPFFSKIIAVSYSAFDNFEIPRKTASFNYVYCGLKDQNGKEKTSKGQVLRFHISWKKIKDMKRMFQWRTILLNFIEEDLVNQFIIKDFNDEYDVDLRGFNKIKKILSSGQNIILYIITEIIANIRYDSLILYDEPETHLHPNAISQLINTIYELVNEFQSYCIITTHSPLIIRELMSKSIYVLEKHNNIPSIRKPSVETFGENLTVLTEDVFGTSSVSKQYKKIIKNLIENGKSLDDIVSIFEDENVTLSLNVRLYIQSVLNEECKILL